MGARIVSTKRSRVKRIDSFERDPMWMVPVMVLSARVFPSLVALWAFFEYPAEVRYAFLFVGVTGLLFTFSDVVSAWLTGRSSETSRLRVGGLALLFMFLWDTLPLSSYMCGVGVLFTMAVLTQPMWAKKGQFSLSLPFFPYELVNLQIENDS